MHLLPGEVLGHVAGRADAQREHVLGHFRLVLGQVGHQLQHAPGDERGDRARACAARLAPQQRRQRPAERGRGRARSFLLAITLRRCIAAAPLQATTTKDSGVLTVW